MTFPGENPDEGAVRLPLEPIPGKNGESELRFQELEGLFAVAIRNTLDGKKTKPELILAAFSSAVAGILARVDKVRKHLGDNAELENLFSSANRTLWYRVKGAHKGVERIHKTADAILTNPGEVLNHCDLEEVQVHLAEAESLDPVELGTKLQDRASRIHDVRNQLTVLLTTLYMLRIQLGNLQRGKKQLVWSEVDGHVQRVLATLDRMESTLTQKEIVGQGLSGLSRGLKLHFSGLNIHVNVDFEQEDIKNLESGREVLISSNDLYRVLFNLSDNAKNAGASRVSILFKREGNLLRISVQDDGPGFGGKNPLDAHKESAAGHGYGVQGCRALVEASGGTFAPVDLVKEGAEWLITLPLNPADPR